MRRKESLRGQQGAVPETSQGRLQRRECKHRLQCCLNYLDPDLPMPSWPAPPAVPWRTAAACALPLQNHPNLPETSTLDSPYLVRPQHRDGIQQQRPHPQLQALLRQQLRKRPPVKRLLHRRRPHELHQPGIMSARTVVRT